MKKVIFILSLLLWIPLCATTLSAQTDSHAFTFTPRLPKDWDHMSLNKIGAFGHPFDIAVKRTGTKLNVIVSSEGKTVYKKNVKEGEAINIKL